MLYGRLVDNNSHRGESLADLSYPVVLLQGRKTGGDRFIESLRSDLCGVLNVPKILYRYCARSKNHVQKRSIFVFCSPVQQAGLRGVISPKPRLWIASILPTRLTRPPSTNGRSHWQLNESRPRTSSIVELYWRSLATLRADGVRARLTQDWYLAIGI